MASTLTETYRPDAAANHLPPSERKPEQLDLAAANATFKTPSKPPTPGDSPLSRTSINSAQQAALAQDNTSLSQIGLSSLAVAAMAGGRMDNSNSQNQHGYVCRARSRQHHSITKIAHFDHNQIHFYNITLEVQPLSLLSSMTFHNSTLFKIIWGIAQANSYRSGQFNAMGGNNNHGLQHGHNGQGGNNGYQTPQQQQQQQQSRGPAPTPTSVANSGQQQGAVVSRILILLLLSSLFIYTQLGLASELVTSAPRSLTSTT